MFIIFIYILYYWIIIKYFDLFFKKKYLRFYQKYILLFFALNLQIFCLSQIMKPILLFLCNNLLLTSLCLLLYHVSYKQSMIFSLLGCSTAMFMEIGVAIMLNLNNYSSKAYTFAGNIISKIVLLTIIHLLSLCKNRQFYTTITRRLFFLLVINFMSCIFIAHFAYILYQSESTIQNRTISIIIILALIVLNIAYYIIEDRLSYASLILIQNLRLVKQLDYYKTANTVINAKDKALAKERHNLKNQLLAIRAYAIQNNNSQIIEFINTLLSDKSYGISKNTYCDNLLIDTLLSAKDKIAKKYNIEYVIDIDVPPVLPFDNINLCNLIGNALDNCFDACIQDYQMHKVYVHVTIKHNSDCLYCSFKNSCFHNVNKTKKAHFISTKSSKHGYGLSSIKEIVSFYNGIIDIQQPNNSFTLKTMIYP
ncbi:hypothetical protein C817_02133 [Dorea sp. 5-2]|nr:hypothetical protein C817_02133 [Dorea sp. 5-2]